MANRKGSDTGIQCISVDINLWDTVHENRKGGSPSLGEFGNIISGVLVYVYHFMRC